MENIITILNQYVRSELAILVPVLYLLMRVLGMSKMPNEKIPLAVCGVSVALCGIYTFAAVPISGLAAGLMCVFTAVTQGVLYAGATLFGGIISASIAKK